MKSYFQHDPHERAKLTVEQLNELIDVELMIEGVPKPPTPPSVKTPDPVVIQGAPFFFVELNGRELPFAFRSHVEAASFVALRPVEVATKWEHGGHMKFSKNEFEARILERQLPSEEQIEVHDADLRRLHAERQSIDEVTRGYTRACEAVEKVRSRIMRDWHEQIARVHSMEAIGRAFDEYVRMAGGDKDVALKFLRKAYTPEAVHTAGKWLGNGELSAPYDGQVVKGPIVTAAVAGDIPF